jgi:tRNA 2-selenouridine synthase
MVARNVAGYLDGPLAEKPAAWQPLVYCWRGGQRSGSVAIILRQIGWRVETLEGGYKSYRAAVHRYLYDTPLPHRLILLDGYTGTAKTEILAALSARGVQTLDLEGLARHRGSLFGGMPGGQPAQKGFESQLAAALAALDPARPVVVEAESSKVGDRSVPPVFWAAMCAAPRITVAAPLAVRAAYTIETYNDIAASPETIEEVLNALRPYHPHERIETWLAYGKAGALMPLVTELMEAHYDPRYAKSAARIEVQRLGRIEMTALDAAARALAAERIEQIVSDYAQAISMPGGPS